MSLKNEAKEKNGSALELRNLRDVQELTIESIDSISETVSEKAFQAVRAKSAQKLAFKVACHTDGIVDDALDLLEGFLSTMFVIQEEPLNLEIGITTTTNILEAA